MKGPKIDFSKIAMETAGNLGGLAAVTQINRIPFIAKMDKPAIKGSVMFAIGKVAVPWLAGMAGLNGKKGGDVVKGVSDGISVFALAQLGSSFAPNIFPKISGYEENIYGLGIVTEEEDARAVDGVAAAEESVYD